MQVASHEQTDVDGDNNHKLDEISDHESPDVEKGSPADGEKLDAHPGGAGALAEAQPTGPPPPSSSKGGPPGGPVPNGGTKAWMQVFGSWMLFFNTWGTPCDSLAFLSGRRADGLQTGILNTFGVYQTYYESGQLFTASSSNISWIGSVQAVMVLIVGVIAGPIYDRGHLRLLLLTGSFGVVFGHMMLSLCHTFWQALLAQGFVIGMGAGCLFVPAVAIMSTYFNTKLGLALGLAASGSSTGGIIYPIMFYKLIDQVGFGWSTRILGFTALATLIVPNVVMQLRVKPGRVRAVLDMTAFTDLPFMTFVVGSLVGFIGLYVGFFYFSYFGQATGITDESLSFYLVPILNAGSVLGRTLPNWLSDKIGPLNVIAPGKHPLTHISSPSANIEAGAIMVGIVLLCNLAVHNAAGVICTALFFGFFSGIFIALPPVLFVALTEDKSKVGTRIGMGFAMLGFGVLAGGPGGGGILQRNPNGLDWTGTWVYAGVTVLAAGGIFCVLRVMRGGFKVVKV